MTKAHVILTKPNKTVNKIICVLTLFLIAGCPLIYAQTTQTEGAPLKVLTWFYSNPRDITLGILLSCAGLVGALCTIFFTIGGSIPGLAGQVRIDRDEATLQQMTEKLSQLISDPTSADPSVITAIQTTVNNLRDDLRREQWRQYLIASALYGILGAAFAALLAQSIPQAIVIGAGWTAFIGTFGLKKDYAERKAIKDQVIKEQNERIQAQPIHSVYKGSRSEEQILDGGKRQVTQVISPDTATIERMKTNVFIALKL